MRGLGVILAFTVLFLSSGPAHASVLSQLEKGDVVSSSLGNSVVLQAIVRKNFDEMKSILGGDINALARRTPGLSFVKAFRTNEGRPLLYLKVRGLQDGTSFLMELKGGNQDAMRTFQPLFMSAPSLPLDAGSLSIDNMIVPYQNPWINNLKSEVTGLNNSTEVDRELGGYNREMDFILDGPLNPGLSLAGVRFQLKVEMKAYDIGALDRHMGDPLSDFFPKVGGSVKQVSWTYLAAQLSFRSTEVKEDFSDYRGFRANRLAAAELGARDFVRDLRSVLESM